MAGFFSKFGKQMDELASAAAEKASELKETASEKIEELTKDQLYDLVTNDRKITGTKDQIFDFMLQEGMIKKYERKQEDEE